MLLYKRAANNILHYWKITQQGRSYILEWGQDGTSSPQQEFIECADTVKATKEVTTRTNEMLERRGYTKEKPASVPELPMLCQEWEDHYVKALKGTRDPFPSVAIQPKLDGLRCIASSQCIISRRAEKIVSLPNITTILKSLPPEIKLDGELYVHGVSLQTIQSYVRRNQPHALHYTVEYHVFDLLNDEPFEQRFKLLQELLTEQEASYKQYIKDLAELPHYIRPKTAPPKFPIKIVPTEFIPHESTNPITLTKIRDKFKEYTSLGYEGLIVRNTQTEYELNRRSPNLLKYKEYQDGEFEIVDVVEVSRGCGLFVCRTNEGQAFECNPAWTTEAKRTLLRRKEYYTGRFLKVTFEKYSDKGIPLKPIGHETMERPDKYK